MSNEEIVKQIQEGIDVTLNQERLWLKNKGLIRLVIMKTCGFDDNCEDYEQQGAIGLLTAAMGYDESKGAKFTSYAYRQIWQSIVRYSENCCHTVRTPVYLRERIRRYVRYRQQYRNDNGTYPTDEESMEYLKITYKSFRHLLKTIYEMRAVSIDAGITEDEESSLLDFLSSDEDIEELITHSVYVKELKTSLEDALSILDERTRQMIHAYYYQRQPIERIAETFDCSTQNVYERIDKGFWKILHSSKRKQLEEFMWDGFEYNEYAYCEYAEDIDEDNEFLI